MSGSNYYRSLIVSFCLGGLVIVAVLTTTNTEPVEEPMVDKCLEIGSELETYDYYSFICKNGAEFSADALSEGKK